MARWWCGGVLIMALGLAQADDAPLSEPPCEPLPEHHAHTQQQDAATHAVGGCISGLSGTGLLLIDDQSGQTVQVEPDQSHFQFHLDPGDHYRIEVLSPPNQPLQECDVSNGSGMVDQRSTHDIRITCNLIDEIFRAQFDDPPAPMINQF